MIEIFRSEVEAAAAGMDPAKRLTTFVVAPMTGYGTLYLLDTGVVPDADQGTPTIVLPAGASVYVMRGRMWIRVTG